MLELYGLQSEHVIIFPRHLILA